MNYFKIHTKTQYGSINLFKLQLAIANRNTYIFCYLYLCNSLIIVSRGCDVGSIPAGQCIAGMVFGLSVAVGPLQITYAVHTKLQSSLSCILHYCMQLFAISIWPKCMCSLFKTLSGYVCCCIFTSIYIDIYFFRCVCYIW